MRTGCVDTVPHALVIDVWFALYDLHAHQDFVGGFWVFGCLIDRFPKLGIEDRLCRERLVIFVDQFCFVGGAASVVQNRHEFLQFVPRSGIKKELVATRHSSIGPID